MLTPSLCRPRRDGLTIESGKLYYLVELNAKQTRPVREFFCSTPVDQRASHLLRESREAIQLEAVLCYQLCVPYRKKN